MGRLNYVLHDVMRYVERMGPQEWLFALILVVLVGFVCLRGFGSRTSY
ncbi:MAG: hypothetical protein HUU20_11090 [Pirellulales bacterium]|nr:hypothetical protein [Pirellulales bacterium]